MMRIIIRGGGMRLLNLEVDDLYLIAKPSTITSSSGDLLNVLVLNLGYKISDKMSNVVILGSKKGLEFTDSKVLTRSSYSIKKGFDVPRIWNEGIRTDNKFNILFTGVYTKDGAYLIDKPLLRCNSGFQLDKIRIIAGGLKPTLDGELYYNLVLLVPSDLCYIVDNTLYSCRDDRVLFDSRGNDVSLEYVIRNCKYY